MGTEGTSARPERKDYTKVLQEDLPQEGSLLHKWETINRKRCGVSKAASWIILGALGLTALILLIVLGRSIFSSPETPVAETGSQPTADTSPGLLKEDNSFFGDGPTSTTTIISTRIGADGKLVTETTTEKLGTDKNGQTKATRETKTGTGADKEAEKMMAEMNNLMGGFGGLLGGLFGAPRRDPLQELFGGGGFGGPHVQIQMLPMGNAEEVLERRPAKPRVQQRVDPFAAILGAVLEDVFNPQPQIEVLNLNSLFDNHEHHHHDKHGSSNSPAAIEVIPEKKRSG